MSSKALPRVAIVGAGVIGLSIGWALARKGAAVTVFERERAGGGASYAAAGMLAATLESEQKPEALSRLARHSLDLWPRFARELERASALPVHYQSEGTLLIALDPEEATALRRRFADLRDKGRDIFWLGGDEVGALEPALAPEVSGAILSPGDHQVDNRCLSQALVKALSKAGGTLRENEAVRSLVIADGACTGVIAGGAVWPFDAVVIAAGAWSAELGARSVRPVKGQILALASDARARPLRHVIWAPGAYLAPRTDKVIVGASMEDIGFDARIVPAVIERLHTAACRAVPKLSTLPIVEQCMGFRPATPDGLPLIGPHGPRNVFLATGHHRNGILLAPVTAEIVAELVLTGHVPALARGFEPERRNGA